MFKTRLISGIVLMLVAIATLTLGGNILLITLFLISLIGMSELYKVFAVHDKALGVVGYLATIAYFILLFLNRLEGVIVGIIVLLICLMFVYVFSFPAYTSSQVMAVFFSVFYITYMLSYIYRMRMLEDGKYLVWLIFISSWGSDTCAYCVGMLFGKHKLAPKLSPKKSVEGAIGGVLGASLLGVLFALIMNAIFKEHLQLWIYALIGGVGSVIAQVGDLAASAIKRNHEVKDYGTLIPGHGGILDRFDSVIFTAPVMYYLASMIGL